MRSLLVFVVGLVGCGRLRFDDSIGGSGSDAGSGSDVNSATAAIGAVRLVLAGDDLLTPVVELSDGVHVDVSSLVPNPGFAVEAELQGQPSLVRFVVNGAMNTDEYIAPYTSAGDISGKTRFDTNLRVGQNVVEIIALDDMDVSLDAKQVMFVLDLPLLAPMQITQFALVDDGTGSALTFVTNGSIVPISSLSTGSGLIDIVFITNPSSLGSVSAQLTGAVTNSFIDNWPIYSAYGVDRGFAPVVGNYSVTARPYELGAALGSTAAPSTISFSVTP